MDNSVYNPYLLIHPVPIIDYEAADFAYKMRRIEIVRDKILSLYWDNPEFWRLHPNLTLSEAERIIEENEKLKQVTN